MKLAEALTLLNNAPGDGAEPWPVFLVCGGTPGHLQTFLAAHLQLRLPDRRIAVETGLYGDCAGSLARLESAAVEAAAVVLEWADFDPRLGLRHLGGWRPHDLPDILRTVRQRADQYRDALGRAVQRMPVALSLPTLPLPPVAHQAGHQAGAFELQLRECLAGFATRLAEQTGVRVVNVQRLDQRSPLAERLDVKSELLFGFPYRLPHAAALADLLAELIAPAAPKKGLITDLDDTLWAGLLGEDGSEGVSWDLDHQSQLHGLYQQLLQSLAAAGVLIAVASKNDPAAVDEAFGRDDLILTRDRVYPLEVHWQAKSQSVGRILRAWNVAADSVVFVDDSPLEIAEVTAAHPGIEGVLFPKGNYPAAYETLGRLRDLFGKERLSAEDAFRLDSLRQQSVLLAGAATGDGAAPDEFLRQTEAELTLYTDKEPDSRALELVNKTNQFNLNGRRYTEAEWRRRLQDAEAFVWVVAYKDKFGPLGKIAVLSGYPQDREVVVDAWVLSCRAFARRIEHRCLEQLFERFAAEEVVFDFRATAKNGPLQDCLREFLGHAPEPGCRLTREEFAARCPPLYHHLTEMVHG